MKKVTRIVLGFLAIMLPVSSAQAAVVYEFNANNTATDVEYSDSHDWVSDNTSGNGEIWSAYNENGSQHQGIYGWSAAGLRIRNTTDGGQGTALFGFDLPSPHSFNTGFEGDDDIYIRVSAQAARTDDAGTGARAAVLHDLDWYVSEELVYTGFARVNALDVDWFLLTTDDTPANSDIISIGTSADPATFTDITMVGTWIEVLGQNDGGGNPNSNYGVNHLIFGAVVPEPSTIGLFLLGGGLIRFLRRRRLLA